MTGIDIERLIHHALYHHQNGSVSQTLPVDGMAYFSALNLLRSVLEEKDFYTHKLTEEKPLLKDLPAHSEVFTIATQQRSSDDANHYVLLAKVILCYRLESKGSIQYFFDNFGSHNKMILPRADLKDKVGSLIIPFDLIATINKNLMPIDVVDALNENSLHPSFSHKLSPSPATSFAIDHDLKRQMAFVTHPKMLTTFFDSANEEQLKSLSFDTRLALDLLNSKYNIDVSAEAMKELAEIDEKLANINGSACIEIN